MKLEKRKLDPVIIKINGVDYPAKLTHRALLELEDITGEMFISLFAKMENTDLSSLGILQIIYVALKGGGVDLTLDDLLDTEFTTDDSILFMNCVTELLNRAMGVTSGIADDIPPDKKAKKKNTP
ncbi:MAG: gene transfer agent family protein [Defluviitaleaceae bacterium]|nr:gene transfer agent family protein [Defluviitaleaceae bacterium]